MGPLPRIQARRGAGLPPGGRTRGPAGLRAAARLGVACQGAAVQRAGISGHHQHRHQQQQPQQPAAAAHQGFDCIVPSIHDTSLTRLLNPIVLPPQQLPVCSRVWGPAGGGGAAVGMQKRGAGSMADCVPFWRALLGAFRMPLAAGVGLCRSCCLPSGHAQHTLSDRRGSAVGRLLRHFGLCHGAQEGRAVAVARRAPALQAQPPHALRCSGRGGNEGGMNGVGYSPPLHVRACPPPATASQKIGYRPFRQAAPAGTCAST